MKKILRYLVNKIRGRDSLETLINRGLVVGKNFSLQQECIIDSSHCHLICIGDDVTLAPRVHILAHDASTKRHLGYTKIGRVWIGNRTFVGAGSIILPNVTIGSNVIIGAGSIVSSDIPDNSGAVGNPARVIENTDVYIHKHQKQLENRPVYDQSWTLRLHVSREKKEKMANDLMDGIGYIE